MEALLWLASLVICTLLVAYLFRRLSLRSWLLVVPLTPAAVYLLFGVLPIEQEIAREKTSDKSQIAIYSWRPVGIASLISPYSTILYVTIIDADSQQTTLRKFQGGDSNTLEEAKERLDKYLPPDLQNAAEQGAAANPYPLRS